MKDITQDILQVPTILDVFGNIRGDVSWLPSYLQWLVYGAGVGSFLAEMFLLITLPVIIKKNTTSLLVKWVIGVLFFMLVYFPVVIFLDPRLGW